MTVPDWDDNETSAPDRSWRITRYSRGLVHSTPDTPSLDKTPETLTTRHCLKTHGFWNCGHEDHAAIWTSNTTGRHYTNTPDPYQIITDDDIRAWIGEPTEE